MKIKLYHLIALTFISFLLASSINAKEIPAGDLPSSTDPLKKQYLNLRYQQITCAGTLYLDMNDVSMVKKDETAITAHVLFAGTGYPADPIGFKGYWWLFMKDGKVHYCGGGTDAKEAFIKYITFVKQHPEFMTLQ